MTGGEIPPPAGCSRTFLVQRSTEAISVADAAFSTAYILSRATSNIGLSSLAGSNDFGFLVAHNMVFYLFIVSTTPPFLLRNESVLLQRLTNSLTAYSIPFRNP